MSFCPALSELDTAELQVALAELAVAHRVPLAQLAVHSAGETVVVTATGTGARLDPRGKIPVGSITKCFTAAVAMLLVADDDLDLDDPIGRHLPELGMDGAVVGLTVRQLLSHTSGLPAGLPDPGSSARRYLRACRELRLVQPAGTGFSYSNVGYVLVGRIVERLTGMDWAEAVHTLLLRPLRIEPSFVVGAGGGRPWLSGHAVGGTAVRPVRQTLHEVEAPAGALALSAADLAGFGRSLVGADDFQPMFGSVGGIEPFGLADGWGLGLAAFAGDWFGHDGTADGTSCHLRIDPTHEVVVALASNASSGSSLWEELVDVLRDNGIPVGNYDPGHRLEQPTAVPDEFAGRYTNGELEYVVHARAGRAAELVVSGEAYPELLLHRGDAFSVWQPAAGRRVLGGRFLRDQHTGRVCGLQTGGRVACRADVALETVVDAR